MPNNFPVSQNHSSHFQQANIGNASQSNCSSNPAPAWCQSGDDPIFDFINWAVCIGVTLLAILILYICCRRGRARRIDHPDSGHSSDFEPTGSSQRSNSSNHDTHSALSIEDFLRDEELHSRSVSDSGYYESNADHNQNDPAQRFVSMRDQLHLSTTYQFGRIQ